MYVSRLHQCVFALLFLFIVAHVFDNNFSFFSSFCIICKLHDFTIKFVFFWMAKTKTAATTARNSDRKLKIDDFDSNKVRVSRFSSPLSQRNFRFSTEKCKKFSILEKHFYFRFLSFLSIWPKHKKKFHFASHLINVQHLACTPIFSRQMCNLFISISLCVAV